MPGFGSSPAGDVLIVAAALSALLYLGLTARPPSALRSVTKTLAVLLLAVAAWLGGGPLLLTLALGLCAVGDFCLSRDGEGAFMAGVGAFAAGHLIYIFLFLGQESSDLARLVQLPQLVGVLVLAMVGLAMVRLLAPRAGALKGPVLAYVPIILCMGLATLTLPLGIGLTGLALVLPAAVAFMASDIVLAFETFVLGEDHPARRITPYVVWPLYWGAQAGFLLAFL
ncbi:lysoplasmalogenase [Phaeobacter gallaeciensis]|uniref:Membrane protein n=1 Tax=Phaeobacter gallaeciensis TaxID=60890 RepID=A0AAD0EC31_9RHOB|nr:lysoplasmalogenase [Phaeobacter gallaeciensis]AHD08806.1 putative membrane protein [Phaeobacter gallaeciensis DSM 26640]ATE92072.1 putative membrane protein [Phaeobacter gallaeciensis]ATE98104.1 putative membrane protein [Phaeobacter gallaeciensis]ATF00688.1 putative membrane protein [Phaeobacter gallaeciensis]ATF05119.1 putative membrane protein [Phaeobacter gallaeciensis]